MTSKSYYNAFEYYVGLNLFLACNAIDFYVLSTENKGRLELLCLRDHLQRKGRPSVVIT